MYLMEDLYLEYMKSPYNSINNKVNNPIEKWAKDLNRHFSKGDTQTANNHRKRNSVSLVVCIGNANQNHFTPTRMDVIKKAGNDKPRQGCREIGTFIHCQQGCKVVHLFWKTVQQFLKKLNTLLLCDLTIPFLKT